MRPALVDSNVLLDIATEDPNWFAWSSETLPGLAASTARLCRMVTGDPLNRELHIESVDDDRAAVLRMKTPSERLRIGLGMIDSAISMLRSLLTVEHPDWTAEQIQTEFARRISRGEIESSSLPTSRVPVPPRQHDL